MLHIARVDRRLLRGEAKACMSVVKSQAIDAGAEVGNIKTASTQNLRAQVVGEGVGQRDWDLGKQPCCRRWNEHITIARDVSATGGAAQEV